ncbi:unnamed protein product [Sphacelaria rigidula]
MEAGDLRKGIRDLLNLEEDLNRLSPSIERDARVNLLKYLQVNEVKYHEREADGLYVELVREEGLDMLRTVHEQAPVCGDLIQPREEGSIQDYLDDAALATEYLETLLEEVEATVQGTHPMYVVSPGVKSLESATRKADKCGGIRKLTDMARLSVVCDTSHGLARVFELLKERVKDGKILSVRNGFVHNYRRGGYRDVKVFVSLRQHVCEIQLHLASFFSLKDEQHVVYEWARRLNVTVEMKAENLFQNMGPKILDQMVELARGNWQSTGDALPFLRHARGDYAEAEQLFREGYDKHKVRRESKESAHGKTSAQWTLAARLAANASNNLASALASQGKHGEAEHFFRSAVSIWEEASGSDTPDVSTGLNNLAGCFATQGKHHEADLLYLRSIEIVESTLGPAHPSVARGLNNRGGLLDTQGKYAASESMYIKAQEIFENSVGRDSLEVVATLNNRAMWCRNQGRYDEADGFYLRAIAIGENILGPHHPELVLALNNQANSLCDQGKLTEARRVYQRAIDIFEKTLGEEHPNTAMALTNLAGLLKQQRNFDGADRLYQRALVVDEKVYGSNHNEVATVLNNWGELLELQGKYDGALLLYERSLTIREAFFSPEHAAVGTALGNKAGCLMELGDYAGAENLYRQAQKIFETSLGPNHRKVGAILNNRGVLLKRQKRYGEALHLHRRALTILVKALGVDHPDVAVALGYNASCLTEVGEFAEAGPIYRRAHEAFEKSFGPRHSKVASILNMWALSLEEQGEVDEADTRYLRAIEIAEEADHLEHAKLLNNRAFLLRKQGRYDEVVPLLERALGIRKKMLGEHDKYTLESLSALGIVQEEMAERESPTSWWRNIVCNVS